MLGSLPEDHKLKWCDFVQPLVHAYNYTKNGTTRFSRYQLMFGRQLSLPIDVAFGLTPEGQKKVTHTEYVKKLRERKAAGEPQTCSGTQQENCSA